jgi:hypothetical protein
MPEMGPCQAVLWQQLAEPGAKPLGINDTRPIHTRVTTTLAAVDPGDRGADTPATAPGREPAAPPLSL